MRTVVRPEQKTRSRSCTRGKHFKRSQAAFKDNVHENIVSVHFTRGPFQIFLSGEYLTSQISIATFFLHNFLLNVKYKLRNKIASVTDICITNVEFKQHQTCPPVIKSTNAQTHKRRGTWTNKLQEQNKQTPNRSSSFTPTHVNPI